MKYLFILFFISFSAFAQNNNAVLLKKQRLQFEQAEQALKKNQRSVFEQHLQSLEKYPLYPYLIYADLKQKITRAPQSVSLKQLNDFEKRFDDFPHHFTLRKLWLTEMAKHKHWANVVKGHPTECKDAALSCQYLYAQYQQTHENNYLKKGKSLWLSGKNQPPECDLLFKAMKNATIINRTLIWERITLAVKAKNNDLLEHLGKSLSTQDRKTLTAWEKGLKNPTLITQKTWVDQIKNTPSVKTALLSQVLNRLAKQDAETAHQWYTNNDKAFAFSDEQKIVIEQDIAMYLSHQRSNLAIPWMSKISPEALDRSLQEWRIRLHLFKEQYQDVLREINQLPELLQNEPVWQYWKARSLEKLGKSTEAKSIYQELAQERTYYGLLSSQRLKLPFSLNHDALIVSDENIKTVEAKPSIQRFYEFQALKRISNARVEWFRALDKMTDDERTAAAKIAEKMGLYDIALQTVLKTSNKNDISLRFPLIHKEDINTHAKKHALDPAWVYGLIRQESGFHEEAVSSAGACGLMQIMPDTGKALAKGLKIPYDDRTDLFNPKKNIQMGSAYIKDLKARMWDHPILTTAAYNAGPNRAAKWLPEKPMDPEIWIETIPYRETRDYVKHVVTFTAVYCHQLNTPNKTPMWMRPIPAKD